MKMPAFTKTIRFRLALWYSVSFLTLYILLIIGTNLAVGQLGDRPPLWLGEDPRTREEMREQWWEEHMRTLAIYSVIGFGGVLLLGSASSYWLSGRMLKPVDRVSALASRISHTNLKERIHHEGPEDEVKRLADTFDDMLERLEDAFASQKRFLQDASHELRTPIAIAQTNIEVVDMQEHPTTSDYEHLTQVLKMSLERMNRVNDNLLLLSEGDQSHYRWTTVDMKSLLDEVATEAEAKAITAGLSLELDPVSADILTRGDATRLKQAIMNLVDNAIKYNQPEGMVKLSAQGDGSLVVVQVQDTGIGISQPDLQRVFDRFYRVDKSRSRSMGGSGLGLSIVRRIVEDHGGAVTVTSTLGEGSTFRIALPRHVPE